MLATVLDRATPLTVVTAEDGMTIRHGHVYVAPPDFHLVIDGDHVRLTHGPREHRFRPAVDPCFGQRPSIMAVAQSASRCRATWLTAPMG
jgi:two-component system chemotaxis response regulator CheB